jgi:hypothetical protein
MVNRRSLRLASQPHDDRPFASWVWCCLLVHARSGNAQERIDVRDEWYAPNSGTEWFDPV